METPLQLEFHGFEPSAHVRGLIEDHVAKFEDRFGRITSCRVVVRQPGAHHKTGEPYAVSIAMAIPGGRSVNVSRKSNNLDQRLADINFAINEAFRRAARQLSEKARRMRGEVKQHNEAPVGRVKNVEPAREFGFLETEDGREIYFHAHSVLEDHFPNLRPGDRVAYHEEAGEQGPQASTVRLLNPKHH